MAIKGKLLMVNSTIGHKSGVREFRTIAYATDHTLDLSSSLDSVATKDDNELYKNQEITSQDWSVKTENLIAADPDDEGMPTYTQLLEAMKSQTQVELYFSYLADAAGAERTGTDWITGNGVTATPMATGYAYITSLELNAENKTNVSYTATFQGAGAIS